MEFEEIWSKMTGGEIYDATHGELVKRLEATREKIWLSDKSTNV